jgi:quercetin dioxygenase-like cupin family protein
MKGKFIRAEDVDREELSWGVTGWISRPSLTGATDITVMEVKLNPGSGHAFHKHPHQEEVIYVMSGEIEQWLETEKQMLQPGDSIFIDADVVHASFNDGAEPAILMVVLGPCDGEGGYTVDEMADQAPWNGLR